jgi:hypothetical protein
MALRAGIGLTLVAAPAFAAAAPAAHEQSPGIPCGMPPLIGVNADNRLVRFESSDPGEVRPGPQVSGLRAEDERIRAVRRAHGAPRPRAVEPHA